MPMPTTRHCVPGCDEWSRWDEEGHLCLKIGGNAPGMGVLRMMNPEGAIQADGRRIVSPLQGW
jgi:hypothetical protein